jgi:hypothetical protein
LPLAFIACCAKAGAVGSTALLAAFYALCMAVYMWFDIWAVRHFGPRVSSFLYRLVASCSFST